jgi:hypothetical protein
MVESRHLLKRNFSENWSLEKEKLPEVSLSRRAKRSVSLRKDIGFNRLTLAVV